MQKIFTGSGPVFEAANRAFSALFEGSGVSKTMSRARHLLVDEYGYTTEDAMQVVHLVKNTVFDPMAAPGTKPETDPNFKQHIGLILPVVEYVAHVIMPEFDVTDDTLHQRVSHLGENIRDYLSMHRGASLDEETIGKLDRSLKPAAAKPVTGGNYVAIPVGSSAELREKLKELGATDVEWCIQSETAWAKYSDDDENQFYILYDRSRPRFDRMSMVGTFVTPSKRVANAFDRSNTAVKFAEAGRLLAAAGVEVADMGSLESALEGQLYDLADLVDECKELYHNVFLVNDRAQGGTNIVVYADGRYRVVLPEWVDADECQVLYDRKTPLYVTDGHSLYSLQEPYGELCGRVPDGLTIGDSFAIDNAPIIFVTRDGRAVNLLDANTGELLLAESSDVPFTDARFCGEDRFASTGFSQASHWILSYEPRDGNGDTAKFYVVTKKGQDLADCPCTEIPPGFTLEDISRNGKFYSMKRWARTAADEGKPGTYLMSGGNKVLPDPYRYIDDNGDGTWYIFNSSAKGEPYYLLDTDSGNIELKRD